MSTRMRILGGLALTSLFAAPAFADILGSAHDLQAELGINEICVTCHAPHNNENAAGELLWNHAPTTQSFTAYSSPTLDGASAGPGATSVLCLGCHDGTIAVDSYGGATGTLLITNAAFTAGVSAFGADLSNDHPVGVTYDPVADTELNGTDTAVTFGVGTGTVADMLQGGAVECASCHDVHNTISAGNTRLLNVSNAGSGLCLACHSK